jgi:AAA15 family ATPase/GTPase
MLMRFEVSNFQSFNEKIVFDFTDVKNYEFNNDCIRNGIVNKGIIYGPNGCGKTNLGYAILDIVSHLTDSPKETYYYYNYSNGDSKEKKTKFNYIFKFADNLVEYKYEKINQNNLIFEELKINNEPVISYNHAGKEEAIVNLSGAEGLNKNLEGTKISVVKYVSRNTVLKKDDKRNKAFKALNNFVSKMLYCRTLAGSPFLGLDSFIGRKIAKVDVGEAIIKAGLVKEFELFLKKGNVECKLTEKDINGKKRLAFQFKNQIIDFDTAASAGTLSLSIFFYWLQEVKKGNVAFVFIDEFDAFYHHKLSKLVVETLKETEVQTIFTTHNTSIMTNDLLRPDCYFIMDKNKITPIYRFTEKELRRAHNIEKMYKAGVFSE